MINAVKYLGFFLSIVDKDISYSKDTYLEYVFQIKTFLWNLILDQCFNV